MFGLLHLKIIVVVVISSLWVKMFNTHISKCFLCFHSCFHSSFETREKTREKLKTIFLITLSGPTKKKWRSDREANRHGSLHAQPYSILKKMAIHLATNRDGSRAEVPPEKKWRALSCLRDHLKTSFFACTKIVHASIIFPLKSPPQWFFRREIVLHDTPISSQYGYVFLMVF